MQHNELLQAWNEDQKVKALKIAIQCSKFLCDTKVIKFYPSKFVLITEILDTFGRLVFERLRGRSKIYTSVNSVPRPLPGSFLFSSLLLIIFYDILLFCRNICLFIFKVNIYYYYYYYYYYFIIINIIDSSLLLFLLFLLFLL